MSKSTENVINQVIEIKNSVDGYLGTLEEPNLDLRQLAISLNRLVNRLDKLSSEGIEDVYGDIRNSATALYYGRNRALYPDSPSQRQEIYNRLMGASSGLYRFLTPEISYLGKTHRGNFYLKG